MAIRWRIAALAFAIAFSGAAAPGPMLALVLGQTLAGGVRATLFILVGHALLEALTILLLARGLGKVLARPRVRHLFGIGGGAILVWMGLGMLSNLGSLGLTGEAGQGALAWPALIVAGMVVSLSNPYFTSWWATVGAAQFATLKLRSRTDYLLFWSGHELGDAGWYLPISIILAFGGQWLTPTLYQWILATCGLLIIAIGILFVATAIRRLRPAI